MGPVRSTTSKLAAAVIDAAPDLAKGAGGPLVKAVQEQLVNAGEKLKVDGDFGDETTAAVKSFQAKNGLKVDGKVGDETLTALLGVKGAGTGEKPVAKFDLTKELASPDSELSVAIGMAEGTRTADGGKTPAYAGHQDPGNKANNKGTFSYQGESKNAREADQKQLESMRKFRPQYEEACRKAGIDPGNKLVAAACFDLYNQAPEAATGKGGLLEQLPALAKKGLTEESLAKARKEAFFDPATGKYDTTFGSIKELGQDQARRMSVLAGKVGGGEPTVAAPKSSAPVPAHKRPEEMEKFRNQYEVACRKAGIDPNDKLVKATCYDFYDKYPKETTGDRGLLSKLPQVASQGVNALSLTRARLNALAGGEENWRSDHDLLTGQDREMKGVLDKLRRDETVGAPLREYTPVSAGKIGFGSQGPEVLQLKKDLKAAGFYTGALNDKMGNDGIAALEKAKAQLGLGGPKDIAGPETLKAISQSTEFPTLHVPVNFLSQLSKGSPRAKSSDCDNACQEMMETAPNPANRVTPRDGNDNVIQCGGGNLKGTKAASDYLFDQLKAGKPVMIGVDYKEGTGKSNVNDIDHYLVVTGSGVDKQGRQYLTFLDPQQPNARLGSDSNTANRLYKEGNEYKQHDVRSGEVPYTLRGVVRNK